jgi:hypothetical protein
MSELFAARAALAPSLNLSSLQRYDSAVINIIHTCSQVALYELDVELSQWSKQEIEGPFFIIERNIQPYYALFILNRRSIDNYIEYLSSADTSFELQEHYLFYQTQRGEVMGLWFYHLNEAKLTIQLLNQLVKHLNQPGFKSNLSNNSTNNQSKENSSHQKSANKPNLTVNTAKPLLDKAPPPTQLQFAPAIESNDERALKQRLNSFLNQFETADEEYQQAHKLAKASQIQPSIANANINPPNIPSTNVPQQINVSTAPAYNQPIPVHNSNPSNIQNQIPTMQAQPANVPSYPPASTILPTPPQSSHSAKAAAIRQQLKQANKTPSSGQAPATNASADQQPAVHPLLSQMFASAAAAQQQPNHSISNESRQQQNQPPAALHHSQSDLHPTLSKLFQSHAAVSSSNNNNNQVLPPVALHSQPPQGLTKESYRAYLLSVMNDPAVLDYLYYTKYLHGQGKPF